jgi:hypothetical protein
MNGYPTAEIEKTLTLMCDVLHRLQSQRRAIAEALDGDFPPPRIAQPAKSTRRRANTHPVPVAASAGGWRAIYSRLAGS